MANSLFPQFERSARRAWQKTDAYKTFDSVRRAIATPGRRATTSIEGFERMLRTYSRHGISAGLFKQARGVPFQDMVREVIRYQNSGGEAARLVGQLLGALGPMGRLLKSLLGNGSQIRTGGIQGEIEAAVRFLQAFAPEKLSPQLRTTTAGQVADSLTKAVQVLEEAGHEIVGGVLPAPMKEIPTLFPKAPRVRPTPIRPTASPGRGIPPGRVRPTAPRFEPQRVKPQSGRFPLSDDPLTSDEQIFYPHGVPKDTTTGAPRTVVDIEGRRFPIDHPVVTKRMVPASSSNVHSYGYDVDSLTLYVRYLAPEKYGRGPGSLYAYDGVRLVKFLSMLDAPSKGIWLWDNVRIRGTWSGHRHPYRLAAVRNDYVPRMATYAGGGREKFIPRTVRVQSKRRGVRTLTSQLPEAFAPEFGQASNGEPNRGLPPSSNF